MIRTSFKKAKFKKEELFWKNRSKVGRFGFSVTVSGDEFDAVAKKAASWYDPDNPEKPLDSQWKEGLRKDAAVVGAFCETGFDKIFGCGVDLEYHRYGGKFDFKIGNIKIDIKGSAGQYYNLLMKCRENINSQIIPMTSDVFVTCDIDINTNDKIATIVFYGWKEAENILSECKKNKYEQIGKKRYSVHYNYEVHIENLNTFESFFEFLCLDINDFLEEDEKVEISNAFESIWED